MLRNHLLFCFLVYFLSLNTQGQTVFQYEKKWELISSQSFTLVGANFDSDGGGYDKLPSGHRYQVLHVEPKFRYGLGPLGLRTSFLYGYAQSEDGLVRRSNGAIDHIAVGLDYRFELSSFILVPRIQYRIAQSKNDRALDVVAVGDGVNAVEAGLEFFASQWFLPMIFEISYLNRDSLAQLLKLSTLAQIRFLNNQLYGGIQGYSAVVGESHPNSLSRNTWFCRANGCAAYAQALNPSIINVVGGYSGSSFGVELSHAINGVNVAQDTRVNFFIKLTSFESAKSKLKKPLVEEEAPLFIEDTQSTIDDEVFKAPKVINPVAPIKNQNPQKSLDQIEMQLELRQKKKKKNRR
jgi:hypothetical protein